MRWQPTFALVALLALTPALAQDINNPQTNASALTTGTLAAARGGAGTINGALKGNGSGVVSQAACADLSNAGGYCSISAGMLTNSLAGNVALNNTGTYFDGPVVAQGSTGTWFASGTVTITDSGAAAAIQCKLWDGTTVFASARTTVPTTGAYVTVTLSGFRTSPTGNIRISCNDPTATTGSILANVSSNGNDSTITAFRIN